MPEICTPDFEKFLLQASAFFPEEERSGSYTGEFSWSYGKHSLFHFCRRAFYFHYILAQGGWDRYANALCRQAYKEKYLLSFEDFLEKTAMYALCNALPDLRELIEEEERQEILLERMKFYASKMLFLSLKHLRENGAWKDPRFLSFRELYYKEGSFSGYEDLMECAREVLRDFFRYFPLSDMYKLLTAASSAAIRYPEHFPHFLCENVPVFQKPFFSVVVGGYSVQYRFSFRDRGEEKETAGEENELSGEKIFALYVQKKYPFCKAKIHTFFLPVSGKEGMENWKETFLTPAAAEIPLLLKSCGEIRKYLLSAPLEAGEIRKECREKKCFFCRFRGVCEKMEKNIPERR